MYGQEAADCKSTGLIDARPRSLTKRITDEKAKLEARLEEINGVLESLEANPETQAVMDAVARLGHFGY